MKKMKLREIRSILDKYTVQAGSSYACYHKGNPDEWSYLPELRAKARTKYSGIKGYSKHVDRMISKHGPDAEFYSSGNDQHSSINRGAEPIGGNDEEQSKGVRAGLSSADSNPNEMSTSGKQEEGSSPILPPCSRRTFGDDLLGPIPRGNSGGALSAADGRGQRTMPYNKGKFASGLTDSLTAPSSNDSQETVSTNGIGKKPGLGTLADTKGRDAFRPMQVDTKSLKPLLNKEASEAYASTDWGMYPHPIYSASFSAFTTNTSYALPPMSIGNSFKHLPITAKEELEVVDGGGFSNENAFGSDNPGGFIDAAMAKLASRRHRAQARSIRRRMEMIFRDTEIGCGQGETPRISAVKLVKELVGKSFRMSKTRKEEKGDGLKLILVDISPSCASIRDACYAAALAIADVDSDVVVYCHFNGYFDTDDGMVIGSRHSEVPVIRYENLNEDMKKFEEFLGSGKLSGAIAFGDNDAAKLYALLGLYAPTVWMTPFSESESIRTIKEYSEDRAYFDKASLFIVPNVESAESAVKGMEAVLKAKKL